MTSLMVSSPSVDVNLLLVLATVLAEQSVARAARRLHVTPSAVSNALARLRVELGDPLVTRKGRGIVPTPRATELAPALLRAFADLERAVARTPFDAASCTRTFTLAMADAGQIAYLPTIASEIVRQMPKARLRVIGIDSLLSLGDLTSSEVDVHVGVPARGAGIHVDPLHDEATVLVARSDHAVCGRRLSRRNLAELRHVAVEMAPTKRFRDRVTSAYARAGIDRAIAVTVPTFAAAAFVAAASDLVATLPASVFATYGAARRLRAVQGPIPVHTVTIALCWHERTHTDAAASAFRTLVRHAITDNAVKKGPR